MVSILASNGLSSNNKEKGPIMQLFYQWWANLKIVNFI